MSRADYLRREIELAWRNAKGAETIGNYGEAAWWESRAFELQNELEEVKTNGGKTAQKA